MTAARELGIIDKAEFDRRMLKFLATLNKLDLFRNELPNKAYNTISGQKVNYQNKPGEIGFSALDIGRMLIWLKVIRSAIRNTATASIMWCWGGILAMWSILRHAVRGVSGKRPAQIRSGRPSGIRGVRRGGLSAVGI